MQKKAVMKASIFWLCGSLFFTTGIMQPMSRVHREKQFLKHKKPYATKQKELVESMVALLQQAAMEVDSEAFEVVTGDLVIVPGGVQFFYTSALLENREKSRAIREEKVSENLPTTDMTLTTLYDLEGNALAIEPDDLIATVLIQSKECEQWGRYLHPILGDFPLYLPVSLLRDKHEGDVVSFLFQKIETDQRFIIELTCRQQTGLYYPAENFEDTMIESLRYLQKTLSFRKESEKKQKNKKTWYGCCIS